MKFNLGVGDPNVKRYIKINAARPKRVMLMFGIEFYRQVTIATPVDTGRARLGWNCSVGSPDLTVPPPGKYELDSTRAERVFTVQAVSNADSIYISNAVPYIGKLNDGWSSQAPARFVELCFTNAVDKLFKLPGVTVDVDKYY
jgi:hypothetical protein